MRFAFGSPLADLELAPLNPDLGRYFGASEGILVISVPADSKLGLKGGDVVLAVDGREPANASHLLRILRSYEGSESFKLDIMRDKKRMTIVGKIGTP
jgi:S1-C subfamily serine protease